MTIISQYYEINISKIFKLEIVTGPCIASPRFGFLRKCSKKKNIYIYMWNLALKFLQVQGLDFLSKCAKN